MNNTTVRCVACDPDGERAPHEAHVLVWQVGGVWVPSCSDRVIDWWHTDSAKSYQERVDAAAPTRWIRTPVRTLIEVEDALVRTCEAWSLRPCPSFTCGEVEDIADLLRYWGRDDVADALIDAHADEDEPDDMHFKDEETA